MQFYTWMKHNFLTDDSPKGDLARDIKDDGFYFPKAGRQDKVKKYLICRNASDKCLKTFEECWKEYTECEKKILKTN